jgi:hypothetical protein
MPCEPTNELPFPEIGHFKEAILRYTERYSLNSNKDLLEAYFGEYVVIIQFHRIGEPSREMEITFEKGVRDMQQDELLVMMEEHPLTNHFKI